MKNAFGVFALWVSRSASTPAATAVAFALVAIWALSGPRLHYSDYWQLVMNTTSSIITFLMVFVLNYAQNRDTNAINAKLDALILAVEHADNRLVGVERLPHTEAERIVDEVQSLKAIADEVDEMAHDDAREAARRREGG
ncbi:MAG: low affinity iron permease family protein [Candidatus Eremiobacteraeota bacterium]|nr:low affinity iron permease family protein [Candidatus Eremiobacteraeota bacterium]